MGVTFQCKFGGDIQITPCLVVRMGLVSYGNSSVTYSIQEEVFGSAHGEVSRGQSVESLISSGR